MVNDVDVLEAFYFLPDKSAPTVRFLSKMGDSYVLVDEDAVTVSNLLYKTSNVQKSCKIKNMNVPLLTLNSNKFAKVVEDLLILKRLKVEVWQLNGGKLEMVKSASPGYFDAFDDIMFKDKVSSNIIVCLHYQNNSVSAAYWDNSELRIGISKYMDDDNFMETTALLHQLRPCECILLRKYGSDVTKLHDILSSQQILVTVKGYNKEYDNDDTISHYITQNSVTLLNTARISYQKALGCCSVLKDYVESMSKGSFLFNCKYNLEVYDHDQFVMVGESVIRAFSLIPRGCNKLAAKEATLLGLLDQCVTPQGHRLMRQWVCQPLRCSKKINDRLDLVECFEGNQRITEEIRKCLKSFPDFNKHNARFYRKKAKLMDCIKIYFAIRNLPNLVMALTKLAPQPASINQTYIRPLSEIYNSVSKYVNMVEQYVDLDSDARIGEYTINPNVDPDLKSLSVGIANLLAQMETHLQKVASKLNLESSKTLKLDFAAHRGYFFRVSGKDANLIRNNSKFEIIETLKEGVRFTDEKLSALNLDSTSQQAEYDELQSHYVKEMVSISAGYCTVFQQLSTILAHMDTIMSFATLVSTSVKTYVKPKIIEQSESHKIVLKESRHPCMEVLTDMNVSKRESCFIANDVNLTQGESEFVLVTGPNMGGKSTYLRQIGVIAIMAQIGCYVPCEYAELSVIDKVFARIGTNDYLQKGMSTFMAETTDISYIIKSASTSSLILIDELGRGTSTFDGFGLTWAISKYLIEKLPGCLTVFATHFLELTELEKIHKQVKNVHLAYAFADDEKQPTMLFKIQPGVCCKSFGIAVANTVKFPKSVVDDANECFKRYDIERINPKYMPYINNIERIDAFINEFKSRNGLLESDDLVEEVRNILEL